MPAMQADGVTYSDISIIKTPISDQDNSGHDANVIYSQVHWGVPACKSDSSPSADVSAQTKPHLAESSPKERHACLTLRYSVLLLSVCVLLLALAVAMGGLYVMKKEQYSELKERNDNLTKEITKLQHELQGVRRCADNWEHHDGTWYHFSNDQKNWSESRDACVAMGGYLAIVKTLNEWNFLKNRNNHWIGLTQAQPEGSWYWVDNAPLTEPKYWDNNQPDNSTESDLVNGEDCVRILESKWNDYDCSQQLKIICESKSCRD